MEENSTHKDFMDYLLNDDKETFDKIIEETTPFGCKKFGRTVKNFNKVLWTQYLEETNLDRNLPFQVLLQKFKNSEELTNLLLSTGTAILVEAAENDKIWGIGMKENDRLINDQTQWGQNILGKSLMLVRDYLNNQVEKVSSDK